MAKRVETIKLKVAPPVGLWEKTKAFFNRSESIFLARLDMVAGVVIGAVSLADWTPLFGVGTDITGMSWQSGLSLGIGILLRGVVLEIGRRRGTKTLADGRLVPRAES